MEAIEGGIRHLARRVRDAYRVSGYSVFAVGLVGTIGHPLYWLWWTFVDPQPNENGWMRLAGSLSCLLLLLRRFWPAWAARFLPWYYFATVTYTLPFFFTWYLVSSHYSMIWSMAEVGMVFFLIAIFPSIIALTVNLVIGVGLAVLCANWLIPQSLHADPHLLLYTYLPVFTFGIVAGVTFSYSNLKGMTAQAKSEALRALAGTIAHEMRNPLSQLRYVLDRIEDALDGLDAANPGHAARVARAESSPQASHVSQAENVASLAQHVAHGQLAIDRGLRIIAMTLDEVSAKPIRADNLAYLSAAATTRKALDEYGFSDRKERSRVRLVVLEDFTFKVDETVYLFTMFNLVRSALQQMASAPASTLTITVERHKVTVLDTAPGVVPDLQPHRIEAPGASSASNAARAPGYAAGSGLGLAYWQRAMLAFGCTIACHAEPGKYTEFTLAFPPVSELEIADHRRHLVARAAQFFEGKRILVVDDDVSQLARVHLALSAVHAHVGEASSGEVALAMLREAAPWDAVLMDLNMPGMDGYATTELLRADESNRNRNVLVIGHTVEPHSVAHRLALAAGMDESISKSSSAVELMGALQALMENGDRRNRNQRFDGFAGKTILLADDETYSRMMAKNYLERCGASVIEAEHGQAVLDWLDTLGAQRSVDAIVLDLNMPGLDGLATAARIRARGGVFEKVPVIALTGQSGVEALRACLAAGMNEVLIKPVRVGALYTCLSRQFSQSAAAVRGENVPREAVLHVAQAFEPDGIAMSEAALQEADDSALLDEAHLEELASLDMLDPTFLKGIVQIRSLLEQLTTSVQADDIKSAHYTLHILLGISGNIGAKALHDHVRLIYPRVLEGQWPQDASWLAQVLALGKRSADALHRYFVAASASTPED
ncbi:ATP-binding response regulator [Paraburkholderia acidisoli]|uniref:histidine kinase n=1 Tax=Paraburkholderia acidisoli TaxID=2571748 RepID=A0A7Z2GN64_9BURK|nr:response regulator [Paraburkholderia acidisoli]QGZ64863.1 response regulator [Paraburkholderia acidisoli]